MPVSIPVGTGFALIDDRDEPVVAAFKWSLNGKGYATAGDGRGGVHLMHRLVAGAGPGDCEVDHRNGNRLDNRRSNLRIATRSQQMANTGLRSNNSSGLKGVSWKADCRKWQARITVNGLELWLGLFSSKVEAGRAYDCAALDHFGEHARLNGTVLDHMTDEIAEGGPGRARGECVGNAHLTEADVRVIRRSSERQTTLAIRFGISQAAISNIRTGRTWRHVA